jgi:hypothetical protein
MIETPPSPSGREISPGGMSERNGTQRIPNQPEPQTQQVAQAAAPASIQTPAPADAPPHQFSEDGVWEWSGTRWLPTQLAPEAQQQIALAVPPVQAPPAGLAPPLQTLARAIKNLLRDCAVGQT